MTPEQASALIIAVTGLIGVLAALYRQVRRTHLLVNSRMDELLRLTELAARRLGVQEGRQMETLKPGQDSDKLT